MPAALDAREKSRIVHQLFVVFRDRGFEGSSLADLSRATGLGKSSLYHHFPGGKEQMAEAVLDQGKAFIRLAVADVAGSDEPLKLRIGKVTTAFDRLYAGGRNPCVLGKLAAANVGAPGQQIAREAFQLWTAAITELAQESGMPPTRARHFAEDWIARVQGSLILHSANGDRKPFERAMNALKKLGAERSKSANPQKAG